MHLRLGRYTFFLFCIFMFVLLVWLGTHDFWGWVLTAVFGLLCLLGVWDVVQAEHSVLRNYPVIGHVRWLVEMIRPELRQYLLEDEDEATPYSRAQRSLVYRRAKGVSPDHPFGTLCDLYATDYEFMQHSICPVPRPDPEGFRILIGNDQCS